MRHIRSAFLVAVLGLAAIFPASALAAPVLSISNATGLGLGNPPFTLGFEFTANTALVATDLGLFDSDSNGLAESHAVGLWDSGGALLASSVVPAGTGSSLVAGFRYVSIAPVLLAAGQNYRVGALYVTGVEPLIFPGNATGFATIPEITFVGSRFVESAALADPDATAGNDPAYFGPNLNVRAVPEPATLALMGLGLAGLARRRFRLNR